MAIIKVNQPASLPKMISDFFENEGFLTDHFANPTWMPRAWTKNIPSANIKEKSNGFTVEVAAPGLSKEDFKVGIEHDVLSISAEKTAHKNEENEKYTRQEFHYDSFTRSFRLPDTINADKIDARYENGLLKINIPKKTEHTVSARKEIKLK